MLPVNTYLQRRRIQNSICGQFDNGFECSTLIFFYMAAQTIYIYPGYSFV